MKNAFFILCLLLVLSSCRKNDRELKVTEYADPFIGTAGEGNCFPGAVFPFGGIQLSPDNPHRNQASPAGYRYSDSIVASFSHTHLSGSPIADFQDIRFLPVITQPDSTLSPTDYLQTNYARFSHSKEQAEPGYYSVVFDNGIKTELSVTERCAMHYYQFPDNTPHALTIDLSAGTSGDDTFEASIRKVNNRTLEGFRKSGGWAKDQRVYFVIEFSQDCQVMAGTEKFEPLNNGQKIRGKVCYAWIDFGEKTDKILCKISLSSANTEGAAANLESELSHWSFDKVKRDARQAWKREFQKIQIESPNEALKKIFYTALYHTYTAPAVYSDVNGNYKGPDGEIHSVSRHKQYTVFPLWETHRAVHPLFTITQRKRTGDLIHSLLKHYDTFGTLPAGELAGNEINNYSGNYSVAVITEAWQKGIRTFDGLKAYEAMKKTLRLDQPGDIVTDSLQPAPTAVYDYWCFTQMARALREEEELSYSPASTGIQHKDRHISMVPPFEIENFIAKAGDPGFLLRQLDTFFTPVSGKGPNSAFTPPTPLSRGYSHNQTTWHHLPYCYNYLGHPRKTQQLVNNILSRFYQPTPDGLPGNETFGQLSAWYVFSAMGFYPANPTSGKYQLGKPLFEKIIIHTGPEKRFIITTGKTGEKEFPVKEILLNGQKLNRTWITHEEIMNGGTLQFIPCEATE